MSGVDGTSNIDEPPSIEVQLAASGQYHPFVEDVRHWAEIALESQHDKGLTVRVVDEQEITTLNQRYRDKNKPTNVLSFSCEFPAEFNMPYLGDIAICAQVVNAEASSQEKLPDAHWAHMVIHGVLHLRGYDHIKELDAQIMEPLEIKLLKRLNIENPYHE